MKPRAYYNEIDSSAAEWLRELVAQGMIPAGDVDERSIEDVKPTDLVGYTQCHFFAGVGGWPLAMRAAGWPDERPAWSGSCPCQPFSAAGKGEGFADERHLWPAFFHLIRFGRPETVFGEQVDRALDWLDLVRLDLESEDYAFGAVDLGAPFVGAPHIRQRIYWMAHDARGGRASSSPQRSRRRELDAGGRGDPLVLANHHGDRWAAATLGGLHDGQYHAEPCGDTSGLGDPKSMGRPAGNGLSIGDAAGQPRSEVRGDDRFLANDDLKHEDDRRCGPGNERGIILSPAELLCRELGISTADAVHGGWGAADWLLCRDGFWRPVEPGTFPLAHGLPKGALKGRSYGDLSDDEQVAAARGALLKGYGNAIVLPLATEVVRVAMDSLEAA